MTFRATACSPHPHPGREGHCLDPGRPLPAIAISPRGVGSSALVASSARIGRIARLPTPTPVMPTPAIARRDDHGARSIHTRVSKGHNCARRARNSHASQQKPDHELVHRSGPPALSDAGQHRAICVPGHVRTELRRRSGQVTKVISTEHSAASCSSPSPTVGRATSTPTRLRGLEPGGLAPVWWRLQIAPKCGRNGPWPNESGGRLRTSSSTDGAAIPPSLLLRADQIIA